MSDWQITTPEAAGFDPALARKFDAGVESGLLRGLHTVAACRHGKLLLERYYVGPDDAWGEKLGHVEFGPDTLHDLRSVSKSITSLLYGIALAKGLVPPEDAPVVDCFPEYPDLVADPARRLITIGHTMNMTMGLEWNEDLPYTNPLNSEIAMERAPDRYRYILDRPITEAPGKNWIYSGGAVALIGAILERGTGMRLPDFAREMLFDPLGIGVFTWAAGSDGAVSAASGLRLSTRDLLRVGAMLVDGGRYDGKQIVPEDWLARCFIPAITFPDGLAYGHLFFHSTVPSPAFAELVAWTAGFGNGGQRLWLMPKSCLACVTYPGQYDQPDFWVTPTRVWREILAGNLLTL